MKQLVLDAGPLIGLFYAQDTYHSNCVKGFQQLATQSTSLLAPIPIIFEVYKWLLQRTQPTIAQATLRVMQASLHPLTITHQDFEVLESMVLQLPDWKGSLEDATVVLMALQYRCPIWTYNFRDFSSFKSLEFWNPGAS
ncbi:type II toxin-antitoxin system VapC family toxin [Leptolyngbya sp. CCY15150]|uniref:type II toxin-antitoxin system VapC family toxin n=1 Tax=Leptolyngbya sp. CCY15150 TaxID=2767772 RepID=UPI001951365B|nr:type II toxin-antitoxin system VapC family toxin [Leptolyngbya sp. CCY15150]